MIGVVWFVLAQRRPERAYTVLPPGAPEATGAAEASPDEAGAPADAVTAVPAADEVVAHDNVVTPGGTGATADAVGGTGEATPRSDGEKQ